MTSYRTKAGLLCVALGLIGMPAAGVPAAAAAAAAAPDGLDHFKCYTITVSAASNHATNVVLIDQFGSSSVTVAKRPNRLCNPVQKTLADGTVTPVLNREAHLVCYKITADPATPSREVLVDNQFGRARLTVFEPQRLCLPSWKNFDGAFPRPPAPPGLDHFKCYRTAYSTVEPLKFTIPTFVGLKDQFEDARAKIGRPNELCNPTRKILPNGTVTPVTNAEAHLVCFPISQDPPHVSRHVFTKNQFGKTTMDTVAESRLCLPSFKQVVPTAG